MSCHVAPNLTFLPLNLNMNSFNLHYTIELLAACVVSVQPSRPWQAQKNYGYVRVAAAGRLNNNAWEDG